MLELNNNFFEECDKHYKIGYQDGYEVGYHYGWDKGNSDGRFFERAELQKAFEHFLGESYSWQELCDYADSINQDLEGDDV